MVSIKIDACHLVQNESKIDRRTHLRSTVIAYQSNSLMNNVLTKYKNINKWIDLTLVQIAMCRFTARNRPRDSKNDFRALKFALPKSKSSITFDKSGGAIVRS